MILGESVAVGAQEIKIEISIIMPISILVVQLQRYTMITPCISLTACALVFPKTISYKNRLQLVGVDEWPIEVKVVGGWSPESLLRISI